MLTIDEPRERRSVMLEGRHALPLEGSGVAWRVESGSVAVFAVELQDGLAKGRRRNLFEIAAGEVVVGLKRPADATHTLLLVPIEATVLSSLESGELTGSAWGRAALEAWNSRLRSMCKQPTDAPETAVFRALAEFDQRQDRDARSRLQSQLQL